MGGASGGESNSSSYGQSFAMNDLFSFADSFNRSNSRQDASSVDRSFGTNQSTSQNIGDSASSSFIDPTQMGFLSKLWGQGQGITNPAAVTAASKGLVGQMMPGLKSAFGNTTALTDPTKQIAAQTASLKSGLGSLFRDEINPAIRSGSIASGGFGGGRQGVAEGVAAGQLADTYAASLGDITANANNQAIAAAGQAGQLGQGIYNMGMLPSMAGFAPLQAMAGLLGSPTVLQEALSRSRGTSQSTGRTGSSGRSVSTGRSSATGGSTSGSVGRSRSGSEQWSRSGEREFGFRIGG